MLRRLVLISLFLAVHLPAFAGSAVLNFDELGLPDGAIFTDQYEDRGVAFSTTGDELQIREASFPIFPGDPLGLGAFPTFEADIVVDFIAPVGSAGAWIDFGNVGEGLTIDAYDGPSATGNLLATEMTSTEVFLGVTADGIRSLRFSLNGGSLPTFMIDHFTFLWQNDQDGDNVPDETDNCPQTVNPDQQDNEGDGAGDACDDDDDNDDVLDVDDNCPRTFNPDQQDGDGDGIGDACEAQQMVIPTLSEWGLVLFAMLLLAAGVLVFRRDPLA